MAPLDRRPPKKSRPGKVAPLRPQALERWGLRVPGRVARLTQLHSLPVVKTLAMIGFREKSRFFLGPFDRPSQWLDLSLDTEKIYTFVESVPLPSTGD